ncbi:MAG: DUF1833 domain-containing protein [Burkholderiaceae bacterium]|nr:DUF1833 domain-containing protein [Burkholderiaceae bacterium]
MPITERQFWARKPVETQYQTVTFSHPAFDAPVRLVANEWAPVTLGGSLYTPAAMSIRPPQSAPTQQPKLTLSFARQQIGRAFKVQLRKIRAAGSRDPVQVDYAVWLQDTDAPKRTWTLYADDRGGVAFDAQTVQVSATVDRLRRVSRAPIYDPGVFTGLASL